MKNFRTYDLSIQFYKDCQKLKLSSIAKDQFDRAILSIPLNLAEGAAKPTPRDRTKFYFIALGSLREVQTLLKLFGTPELVAEADVLAAHLYRLCHCHSHR
jgi:four helix bundle protein